MKPYICADTPVSEELLNLIAHIPTRSLPDTVCPEFFKKLKANHFMRIAVYLARKSYQEAGCPIGGLIIDNQTQQIVGKGHNTLVQGNDPYNHGETAAIRDAGRQDFSNMTLFTTLSPCDVCATLVYMRGFRRIVVGDITNASGNESLLREKGVEVTILEDPMGIEIYQTYRSQNPQLDIEDWKGKAALSS